jgi:multiple sugar transport system ATP-binding protein
MATRIAVMDSGVIQQVGTPDDIYETPANLFVARFIGSPAMNIFEAEMEVAGDAVAAVHRSTGVRMDLSRYGFTRRPVAGMPVAIGLRPEHFAVGDADGMDRAAVFDLPVRYSERAGSDATAFLAADDQLVAVRIDPSRLRELTVGQPVRASFPRDKLNVFDAGTGRRL